MKTDVLALLGRGTLFSAPFRNSISRACLPTMRSIRRDLRFVLLKKIGSAGILIKGPSLSFLTQIWIRLREMSWRLARPWSVSPAMKSRAGGSPFDPGIFFRLKFNSIEQLCLQAAEEKLPHPRACLSPDVTVVSGNNFFKAVGLHLRS